MEGAPNTPTQGTENAVLGEEREAGGHRAPNPRRGGGGRDQGPPRSSPITPQSLGRSSWESQRTQKSMEIMDYYSTTKLDPQAIYPESWPLPTDEEFRALFVKKDIGKLLRHRMIGRFTGNINDYERFKATSYPNVHVQREPAHTKLNKIRALRNQSRRDYGKLRELVDTIYFFTRGVGQGDANTLSLREHLREGMPPPLLKRYMEETKERGSSDTLTHMLSWTHGNVKMHFKHKAFEELVGKKAQPEKKGPSAKPKQKNQPEGAFVFFAESDSSTEASREEVGDVRYQMQEQCLKCQGSHPLYKYEKFYLLTTLSRREFVKGKGLCLICYSPSHEARDCRLTAYKCRFGCKSKHNSNLHVTLQEYKQLKHTHGASLTKDQPEEPKGPGEELSNLVYSMEHPDPEDPDHICYITKNKTGEPRVAGRLRLVAIASLVVEITNPVNGQSEKAYSMADTGASNTHVSSHLGRKLGLRSVLNPFVVRSHSVCIQ